MQNHAHTHTPTYYMYALHTCMHAYLHCTHVRNQSYVIDVCALALVCLLYNIIRSSCAVTGIDITWHMCVHMYVCKVPKENICMYLIFPDPYIRRLL